MSVAGATGADALAAVGGEDLASPPEFAAATAGGEGGGLVGAAGLGGAACGTAGGGADPAIGGFCPGAGAGDPPPILFVTGFFR